MPSRSGCRLDASALDQQISWSFAGTGHPISFWASSRSPATTEGGSRSRPECSFGVGTVCSLGADTLSPFRATNCKGRSVYEKAVRTLITWMREDQFNRCRHRAAPIIMTDLHDSVGQHRIRREFVHQQTTAIGSLGSRPEHMAEAWFRFTCELHGIYSATLARGGSI